MFGCTFALTMVLAQFPAVEPAVEPIGPDLAVTVTPSSGDPAVVSWIVRLQKSPSRREREKAAEVLRHVSWRRHPEIPGALAYSLLHDPDDDVREEVAETLAKTAPCSPAVIEALRRAASADPDRSTRRWARRALKSVSERCGPTCLTVPSNALPRPGTLAWPEPAPDSWPSSPTVLEPIEPVRPSNPPTGAEPEFRPGADSPRGVGDGSENDLKPLPPPADEPRPRSEVEPLPSARRDAGPARPRPVVVPRARVTRVIPRGVFPRVVRE